MALLHSYLPPPLLAAKYQFAGAAYLENHLLHHLGKVLGANKITADGSFVLQTISIRHCHPEIGLSDTQIDSIQSLNFAQDFPFPFLVSV